MTHISPIYMGDTQEKWSNSPNGPSQPFQIKDKKLLVG